MADIENVALIGTQTHIAYPGVYDRVETNLELVHKILTVLGILLAITTVIVVAISIAYAQKANANQILAIIGAIIGAFAAIDIFYVLHKSDMRSLQASFETFITNQTTFLKDQNRRDEARHNREIQQDEREKARDERDRLRDERDRLRDERESGNADRFNQILQELKNITGMLTKSD